MQLCTLFKGKRNKSFIQNKQNLNRKKKGERETIISNIILNNKRTVKNKQQLTFVKKSQKLNCKKKFLLSLSYFLNKAKFFSHSTLPKPCTGICKKLIRSNFDSGEMLPLALRSYWIYDLGIVSMF